MGQLLTITKGDTGPLVIPVWHTTLGSSGLAPYETANGGKIWFYGKHDSSDPDSAAVFTKTEAAGAIAVTTVGSNSVDGVIAVTLAPTDTTGISYDLPNGLPLQWSCKVEDSSGNQFTIDSGLLVVSSQPTSKVS